MRYLLLSSLLLCLGASPAVLPTSSLQDGLVAHYTFNQCDARDDTGQGSSGRMMGNVNCWCGIEGDGLLLDGRTGYITFEGPVNDVFSTTDFSISFYIKPEGNSAFPQSILSKRDGCEENLMLDLAVNNSLKEIQTDIYESPTKFFRDLSPPIPTGNWLHYTVVREGVRAHTYINGLYQKSSFRCSGVDIGNDALLNIADSPCIQMGRARRFKGVIDELRIYDRALTEEEVKLLYDLNPVESAVMDCAT